MRAVEAGLLGMALLAGLFVALATAWSPDRPDDEAEAAPAVAAPEAVALRDDRVRAMRATARRKRPALPARRVRPRPAAYGPWQGPCVASFYDEPQDTASGEQFDPEALTAASRTLPLGTRIQAKAGNGRSVTVRINDRGPYVGGRCLDLSRRAMRDLHGDGLIGVRYRLVRGR